MLGLDQRPHLSYLPPKVVPTPRECPAAWALSPFLRCFYPLKNRQ